MWEAHNWRQSDRLWIGAFTALTVLAGLTIPLRALMAPMGDGFCIGCLAHPLMVFMLLLVYAPAALNNRRIPKGMRGLWVLGFLVGGIVILPMYWVMHVWRAPYQPDADLD